MNNKTATVLAVSMISGENIVDFGHRLRARMAEIEAELPIGFVVDFATFQPDVVAHSVGEVQRTLYETLVIVLVVVMVFLRSEEHTSELPSLMRISYAVFCLKKKTLAH